MPILLKQEYIELNVAFREVIKNADNVIGYINNSAASNIVIATAYDKPYKEENESIADKRKANAQQDNVSGTSMLIELARMLSKSKAKNNNYTFIAYTAEDTLSQDSKWLNNSAITSNANYIINLDKVGRYDEDKKLLIESYRTSPEWIQTIMPLADNNLEVRFDSSSLHAGHSSIGQIKVPVLNFCTQKPANNKSAADNGTINYEGELQIARFIYRLIEAADSKGKQALFGNNEPHASLLKMSQPVPGAHS